MECWFGVVWKIEIGVGTTDEGTHAAIGQTYYKQVLGDIGAMSDF
jgi:hypothetical protein